MRYMDRIINSIPLSSATSGTYRVVSLAGGKGFVRKLSSMGLYPNAALTIVTSSVVGPVRVWVKGTQFGIGRGMASRIIVQPTGEGGGKPGKLYTLRDYREGQRGKILEIRGEGKFKKRLIEMGFVKGAEVFVEKYAPLRDPIEFVVKGYHVGLRRDEAEKIIMTEPNQ
jgi:Fur family ferric uptake transcriptional regulator